MTESKIEGSIVAQGGSTISGVSSAVGNGSGPVTSGAINIKKITTKAGVIGFVLGVISSVIGSYIYSFLNP